MNSKIWIRKALSMCLTVAIIATYSMVALAGTDKIAGELLVTGKNSNGTSFVKVNGENAQNGRSIFSSNTIVTPDNAGAVINLGKLGSLELAPNTTFNVVFNENGISGNLTAGRVTVLSASKQVSITDNTGKLVNLKIGESASATGKSRQDDDDDDGGAAWWIWAAVFGGAIAGIVIAAVSDNNRIALGGGTTVVSPSR